MTVSSGTIATLVALGSVGLASASGAYTAASAFETVAVLDSECESANVDLTLSSESESSTETETACRSIFVGPDYDILAAGDVTMTSPLVIFGNDVQIDGDLTVQIAVP